MKKGKKLIGIFVIVIIALVSALMTVLICNSHISKETPSGETAYQYVVSKGYKGNAREWLIDIAVEHKSKSKSAYSCCVEKGYIDEMKNWLCVLMKNDGQSDNKPVKYGYDVALENGFTGTEEQFTKIFKDTSYCVNEEVYSFELATENGFQGTEVEWLELIINCTVKDGKTIFELGKIKDKTEWLAGYTITNHLYPKQLSAYDLAVMNGFDGDFSSWLTTLAAQEDIDKDKTATLYQYAVKNGYDGTFYEWVVATVLGADDSKSAYQNAVDKGYNQSVEQWGEVIKTSSDDSDKLHKFIKSNGFDGDEDDSRDLISDKFGKKPYDKAKQDGYKGSEKDFYNEITDVVNKETDLDKSDIKEVVDDVKYDDGKITIDFDDGTSQEIEAIDDNKNNDKDKDKDKDEDKDEDKEKPQEAELFTVVFEDYDGTVIDVQIVTKGSNAIPPNAPMREGYDFDGWSESSENVSSDMVISAKYKPSTKPTFAVAEVSGENSGSVVVPVVIKNNPGVLGARITIEYDEGAMTLVNAQNGKAFADSRLTMTKSKVLKSGCNICWDGIELSSDSVTDGEILLLTFEIADNAARGEHPVKISYVKGDIVDAQLQEVDVKTTNGSVKIS